MPPHRTKSGCNHGFEPTNLRFVYNHGSPVPEQDSTTRRGALIAPVARDACFAFYKRSVSRYRKEITLFGFDFSAYQKFRYTRLRAAAAAVMSLLCSHVPSFNDSYPTQQEGNHSGTRCVGRWVERDPRIENMRSTRTVNRIEDARLKRKEKPYFRSNRSLQK